MFVSDVLQTADSIEEMSCRRDDETNVVESAHECLAVVKIYG